MKRIILFILLLSNNITFGQLNKGHIIDTTYSLASISNPMLGLEVLCTCDSQLHYYSMGGWVSANDSLHTARLAATPYINTSTTTSGVATFYLTSDKTITGSGLYSNVTYVNPVINDAASNYTYSWSYNSSTKALLVTAKASTQTAVALIGLTVLGVPANVTNGTSVLVLVKGN